MAAITGSALTTVQKSNWRIRGRFLSVVPRHAVIQAQVDGAPGEDETLKSYISVAYDNVTGDYTNVEPGMTLDVGTSPGARDIGSVRIRDGVASSVIPIAQTSPGALPIANNHYLTVRNEFRLWQVLVRRVEIKDEEGFVTSFVEYHDYNIAYSDQNSAIQPQANIVVGLTPDGKGYILPKLAWWADDGLTYRTITLSALASVPLAPGATITARLWAIGDCTLTSGTLSSETITFRVPVGFRWITLTVTDSNGKTHSIRIPLWTHDASYPPIYDFHLGDDDTQDGRKMTLDLYGVDSAFAESVLARGNEVYFWEDPTFGREAEPAPAQYRPGFLGWIMRDATELKNKRRGGYRVEVGGPEQWMKSVYGFPQKLTDPGREPETHYEMQHLTGDRLMHYVLRVYTNALTRCNFFPAGTTNEYEEFNTRQGTIWSQIADIAKRCEFGAVGADTLGGIFYRLDYPYLTAAQRAARAKTMTLTPAHWADSNPPTVEDEQTEEVGQVIGQGATFDPDITDGEKSTIYAARAPGRSPGPGKGRETAPFQPLPLDDPQGTLNRWLGEHLARANNRRKPITVRLIHNLDVFEPAWNEPLCVTDLRGNLRGLELDGDEFLVRRVQIRHNRDLNKAPKVITLTLEAVTSGQPGTDVPVEKTTTETRTVEPRPPTRPPEYPGGLTPKGSRWVAKFGTDNTLRITANYLATAVVYALYNLSLGGTLLLIVPDAFCPLYAKTGSRVDAWLITTTKIYRITDVFGVTGSPRAVTEQFTFRATSSLRSADFSYGASGHGMVTTTYDDGVYATVTIDGVNWSSEEFVGDAVGVGGETLVADTWGTVSQISANVFDVYTTSVPYNIWQLRLSSGRAFNFTYIRIAGSAALNWNGDSVSGYQGGAGEPSGGVDPATLAYTRMRFNWNSGSSGAHRITITTPLVEGETLAPGAFLGTSQIGLAYTSAGDSGAQGFKDPSTYGDNFAIDATLPLPGDELWGDAYAPLGDESIVYAGATESGERKLKRRKAGTVSDISPSYSGETFGPWKSRGQVHAHPLDPNRVLLVGGNADRSLAGVWVSIDGGDHWTMIVRPVADGSRGRFERAWWAGDDLNTIFFVGTKGRGGYSTDRGQTIYDKSVSSMSAEVVGLLGGGNATS